MYDMEHNINIALIYMHLRDGPLAPITTISVWMCLRLAYMQIFLQSLFLSIFSSVRLLEDEAWNSWLNWYLTLISRLFWHSIECKLSVNFIQMHFLFSVYLQIFVNYVCQLFLPFFLPKQIMYSVSKSSLLELTCANRAFWFLVSSFL